MRRFVKLLGVIFFVFTCFLFFHLGKSGAAFISSRLIDDAVMDSYASMNATQIDSWLNSNFPSSCISTNSGFEARVPNGYTPSGGFTYGNFGTAGQVVATAAATYEINPRVLLVTLEKEQSLISGRNDFAGYCNNGDEHKYAAAMGYGCPDSGTTYNWSGISLYRRNGIERTSTGSTCVNTATKAGFSQQVIRAAWLLKFGEQRSKGNVNWAIVKPGWDNSDDPATCYGGPMTQGTYKRCQSSSPVFYDGYITIDGVSTHMDTGGTAALYWYTPHFHGNQNFVSLYETWFGSPTQLDAQTIINSIPVTVDLQPYATPAVGQTVDYKVTFNNTFPFDITLGAVGAVGRAGSINMGINRDFGWQGPITLTAGTSRQFTFTTKILDSETTYIWPAILYQGNYVQYNNWGSTVTSHSPNFTLSQPLTISPTTVYAGQDITFSAKLKNNEPFSVSYDAIGIPVKFYDRYNYDAVWVGPGVIGPGAEITLSGTRNIDKPGPYTYWVANYFAGKYSTIGSLKKINSLAVSPNFTVSGINFSNTSPVKGENLGASFTVTNNLPVAIDVDAVGVVGRFGTFNGPNRDIGWQGPIHFNAGETKSFSGFNRTVTDLGTHYYWIGILWQGSYLQYNNWGSTVVSQVPSFSVSALSFTTVTPALGENLGASFTVTNRLSVPVDVSAVGVVGRFGTFNGPNRDIGWKGPVHFNAGETKSFSGFSRTITDVGTHYYWIGILWQGSYLQYNNWGSTVVSHN